MPNRVNAGFSVIALLSLIILVVYDARIHFDSNLIELKRQHNSPQRNWNLFYSQSNVYQNSSIRYADDMAAIAKLIEENSIVLSDRASSYYLAAETRSFVKNINYHHGGYQQHVWNHLIRQQDACFPDRPERRKQFLTFIKEQNSNAREQDRPLLKYILVNKDDRNRNLIMDCLAARHGTLNSQYSKSLPTVYQGEYLSVYELVDTH